MPADRIPVDRWEGAAHHPATDALALEEPLEIRVDYSFKAVRRQTTLGLTLRTPGPAAEDEELALGLLLSEGWIESIADVEGIETASGAVRVTLAPGLEPPLGAEHRQTRTSACGLCGREELPETPPPPPLDSEGVDIEVLYSLPARLREAQPAFGRTGGLHAAGLFTRDGRLEAIREDIGRHNALDKLIGAALRAGTLPWGGRVLLLSGRAGYELLQKSAGARTTLVAAMGAPSSMAVDLARRSNITLVGFLREGRCNVYSYPHRVKNLRGT